MTAENRESGPAERLLGAGLVGSRGVGDQLGLSIIALEQIGQIYGQQLEWFVDDQRRTWQMLAETMNPLSTLTDHLERRGRHIGAGFQQLFDAVQEVTERSINAHQNVWSPFASVTGLPTAELPSNLFRGRVMDRLRTDHKRFSQVLAIMEKLAGRLDSLSAQERHVLKSSIDYLSEYPDAVHHPLEDRLFRHLLDAELTDQERNDVEGNATAHVELAAATRRVADGFDSMSTGGADGTTAFQSILADYVELQRRHMAFEEKHVFRLADRKLPAKALRELEDEDKRSQDPLFEQRRDSYDNLYYYVSGRL